MKNDRLLALTLTLLDHQQLSATRLAELFGVSTRTIYRDVDTLALAGIPITTTLGSKGGISILKNYKVDKKTFLPHELANLLIGLKSLKSILDQGEITETLIKLQSLVPQANHRSIETASNQLAIDLSTWRDAPSIQLQIEQIKQALHANTLLAFHYADRNGQSSKRQVEPYRLLFKEASWYLEAFCLLRLDFRTFKLSRMTALTVTTTPFVPRPFTSTAAQKKDALALPLITVTLLIDPSLKERLLTQFSATIIEATPQKLRVTIPFLAEENGYDLLLSLGSRAECLAPPTFARRF